MYIFKTTTTIPSKSFTGVDVTYKKMTEGRRSEIQIALAPINTEIRMILVEKISLTDKDKEKNAPEIMRLEEVQMLVTNKLNPAKIRWAVAGIRGLCIGDEATPATLDNLMSWPSALIEEVLDVIEEGSALSEIERKNSPLVSTSGEAATEVTTSTTVPSAN